MEKKINKEEYANSIKAMRSKKKKRLRINSSKAKATFDIPAIKKLTLSPFNRNTSPGRFLTG